MSNRTENWKDFAKGDWAEFVNFCKRQYPEVPFHEIQKEFAKQMSVTEQTLGIVTNCAAGKLTEAALGGALANVISFADVMARLAGIGFVASQNIIEGRRTRNNRHVILKQEIFGSDWYLYKSGLTDYTQYILYWYPRDRKAGYRGFRYGGGNSTLPKK